MAYDDTDPDADGVVEADVDNAATTTEDIDVKSGGRVKFLGSDTIETAGGGSDTITVRDAANAQDIMVFEEQSSPTVDLPNGFRFTTTDAGGEAFRAFQINKFANRVDIGGVAAAGTPRQEVALFSGEQLLFHLDGNQEIAFRPGGTEAFTLTGSDETDDGMNLNPETDAEDAFLEVDIGSNSYQIPLYDASGAA